MVSRRVIYDSSLRMVSLDAGVATLATAIIRTYFASGDFILPYDHNRHITGDFPPVHGDGYFHSHVITSIKDAHDMLTASLIYYFPP